MTLPGLLRDLALTWGLAIGFIALLCAAAPFGILIDRLIRRKNHE